MKTTRNALLAGAIGLALAAGLAPVTVAAREQAHGQQRDEAGKRAEHGKRADHKRHEDGKVPAARGGERRAHASPYRAERGRQDGAFADSRPALASQQARHRAAERRDHARAAELRDARARQAIVRQQHAAFERREAERRMQEHRRDDHARPVERRQARARLSVAEQQRLIALQRQRAAEYDRFLAARRAAERQRIAALQEQRRLQQYRYQQWYWQQQQAQRQRWLTRRYDVASDPYYYTPASYRYVRDGRAYQVNRYAADLLQQAVRYGYEMGVRAGDADRNDGWRSDWRGNPAYLDASYGYNGYYVGQDEYNYYFRQGFQRGYQDGYGNDYRYGTYYGDRNDGGIATILASVLQAILGLQSY